VGASLQVYVSTNSGVSWVTRETSRAWRGVASSSNGSRVAATVGSGQIYTSSVISQLAFATAGIERMRIDQSGNAGIGTTTPTRTLDVSGEISASADLRMRNRYGVMMMIFWADQTNTVTSNAYSTVDRYSNVMMGSNLISSNGTSNARITLPYTGTYLFEVAGWGCGPGTAQFRVIGTRGGTTVFDRRRNPTFSCGVSFNGIMWNGFLSNDVIEIQKNVNSTGIIAPNVSNTTVDDAWGPIVIYYLGLSNA
jgi:hypothetical protein